MPQGTIIKSTGSWYRVRSNQDGAIIDCRIKGKFRLTDERYTNPVAVGDHVEFEMEKDDITGIINKLIPRNNHVLRSSPRRRMQLQIIASNVDQVMLVDTMIEPAIKPGFIDRYLLTTEAYNIPIWLVFNKSDLWSEEVLSLYNEVKSIYESIGCRVMKVSAYSGEGVDELRLLLKDKITLISGQSGVGKSSLVNSLQEGLDLRTGDISDYTGKGQHTTTFAEMHDLKDGGKIIDTPGIKELGFINLEPMDVAHNFRELFAYSSGCKFNNCLHVNEPDCAVHAAVESGKISAWRYQSYIGVLEEINEQNYWERRTKA